MGQTARSARQTPQQGLGAALLEEAHAWSPQGAPGAAARDSAALGTGGLGAQLALCERVWGESGLGEAGRETRHAGAGELHPGW